ncbi:hypothetical protein CLHOM_26930 [Clostridium homopropionicum DSM 5847]|uniref:Uncharacterized protein n=1 Tax=Clostridium homopropionicum DSM 5847 TaxID=1121318 RepID=A0A0L6Z823_9CLOT|nr:hypothetical protein [Clostridium homopropionicum]KOA18953.1 hypothetical protein CLHOM_26930 [Clostridium homopropionicum DSM 5847]SFG43544.1 ABC-2 type transport system permease protein [Clostridium homopropionicum]
MSRFVALTKALLKTSGESFGQGTNKIKNFLLIILLIACFIPVAILIGAFVEKFYEVLKTIGQEGLILDMGFSLSCAVIFFLGIFYIIGTFYFSMDIENLLPLPFKASQILGAKLAVVVVYEYITQLVIFLPIIISYGIKSNASILYYLYNIIIYITIPIIPLIAAAILVMVIMRFSNIAKNKDRFKLIGGVIAIVIGIGANIVVQNAAKTLSDPSQMQRLVMEGNNSLINATSRLFPSSKFATIAVLECGNLQGLFNLIIFVLITAIAVVIFIILGNILYFKGVIGISQTSTKRIVLSGEQFAKATSQNSVFKAYVLKEIKLLFRTPAYFINCVILNFLWPIFLLIPMFTNVGNGKEIEMFLKAISNPSMYPLGLAIVTVFIVFVSSVNGITATAISREGSHIYFSKYVPINYITQIMAKVFTGFIMGTISMIMLILVTLIIIKLPMILIILIAIIGLIAILFSNFVGIIIDLNNPKLQWDSEQKAVKQNLNVLITLIPCLVFSGITVFFVYFFKFNLVNTAILLVALYGVVDLILYKFLKSNASKLYSNL